MTYYLIIGDLHGNVDAFKNAIHYAERNQLHLVQLGDFTDSYRFSKKQQKKCLEIAIEYQDKFTFLCGNHDLSYIDHEKYRCSGYSKTKQRMFHPLYRQLSLDTHIWVDEDVLVTHAGLSDGILRKVGMEGQPSMTKIDYFLNRDFMKPESAIHKVGGTSGGSGTGGIFWCRPSEFTPIEDITQIFGHTAVNHIKYNRKKNYWNIDTLEDGNQHGITYINGTMSVIDLENI